MTKHDDATKFRCLPEKSDRYVEQLSYCKNNSRNSGI